MTLLFSLLLDSRLTVEATSPLISIEIEALLDLGGLAIAIWTFWSTAWLQLGGDLLRAFRFITFGGLAFALSHLLDSILQLLGVDTAILIHQGAVLVSVLLFLPGLASLADAVPSFGVAKGRVPPIRLWPFTVGLTIIISAASFILFGVGALAETVAFLALDACLVLLSGVCLILVLRARLGGAIGRSLWQALLGLLLFSLAHPVQVWFYEQATFPPETLAIIHRLVVIPAFCLFAISITSVARILNQSSSARMHAS